MKFTPRCQGRASDGICDGTSSPRLGQFATKFTTWCPLAILLANYKASVGVAFDKLPRHGKWSARRGSAANSLQRICQQHLVDGLQLASLVGI